MQLSFVKMHGLGNDFVVIEDLAGELDLTPDAVAWFCDRHFGIGADGLILVRPATTPDADFYMLYHNGDGTLAEMCGNGVRCFAKYLVDHSLVPADQDSVVVETLGGLKPVDLTRAYDGTLYVATVDMGEPVLRPAEVPTLLRCGNEDDMVIGCPLETTAGLFEVIALSMGNPHCVVWVDDVDATDVAAIGSAIENHPDFPAKTNVEFAQIVGPERIRVRVWERGCGETLACGTGACAALVSASLTLRAGRQATVELEGGDLEVRWAENDHVFMTGPAEEVFAGVLTIAEDDEDE